MLVGKAIADDADSRKVKRVDRNIATRFRAREKERRRLVGLIQSTQLAPFILH